MARIENHKYSIEEAFRECFYVIPDYQREYVWTDKEVQQLLDDINEQVDAGSDREYFIGTILVSPRDEKNHYDVIDGQQRLTTFFLLLCALRNAFRGEADYEAMIKELLVRMYTSNGQIKRRLKLDPQYDNASDVVAKIVETESDVDAARAAIQAAGIVSFGSLDNLLNAYGTVTRYLETNYKDPASLKKYWAYLVGQVVFIQISTDVSSALKIFETINERGLGLNSMDLLKNLLFTHVPQAEFTRLKTEWKQITAPLEKEKEKPLRFLRYFLMANYKIDNDRSDAVVREDEIYDWFRKPANAKLCNYANEPFAFVAKLSAAVKKYVDYTQGLGNDGKPSIAMQTLERLCGGAFSLHYVLLLAATPLPSALFNHFVRQLECFLFYYIFTKTPTRELERNFSVWADELRAITGIADSARKTQELNAFVAAKFQKSMEAKAGELSDAFKRYTLRSMQQYRTQYLLAKLTQHVQMAFEGVRKDGALDAFTGLEIEHILPNTPSSDLLAAFRAMHTKNGIEVQYDDCKNRLGNLTLLEKPINIVASNNFFAEKRIEYRKSGNYLTRSLDALSEVGFNSSVTRINKKLRSFTDWNAASIDDRQAMLLDLAQDVWKTEDYAVL